MKKEGGKVKVKEGSDFLGRWFWAAEWVMDG